MTRKKAPPKKRGPGKKNLPQEAADFETLVKTLPPVSGRLAIEWAHEQCKYLYCMSLTKVTIKDLAEHPRFKGYVSVRTLQDWSEREGWVELRRQTAEAWRIQAMEQTGRELVESRREWLRKLNTVGDHVFKQLLPDKKGQFQLPGQSYESMAQALVKILGLIEAMTQSSLDDVIPEAPQQAAVSATEKSEIALKPDLSPEEARIGARAILQARLAEQRRLAAAHDAKVAAEKKG